MTATLTRTALAALLVLGASAGAQPVALVGGRVHTGDGTVLDNATVVIEDGRIAAVEVGMAPPAGARTIDVQGRWVTPGLFDTYSQVGLIEIGTSTAEGRLGENDVSASFQVFEAVNPASQLIPVTRAAGITTVVAAPSGGLISGQAAVLRLAGETLDEVVVDPSVAVVAHLDAGSRSAGGGSRAGAVARLRRVLEDAREYDARREDYRTGRMQPLSADAADLDALVPVVRGEQPLLVTANRRSDIESALRLADEFDLRLVLVRAKEAWQVADRLAARGVPVVLDPLDNIPSYDSPSPRLDNAARLSAAGVEVVFASFESHDARTIRQAAGNAVANGMGWEAALRALTAAPAALLGLDDRGTLAPGQTADLVVWSGDPFEFSTAAERVFIGGTEASLRSRQRVLMERYRAGN